MVIAGASDRGAEPSSREKFFTALVDGRFPRARVTSNIEDCVSRLSLGLLEHGWEPAYIAKAVRRKERCRGRPPGGPAPRCRKDDHEGGVPRA